MLRSQIEDRFYASGRDDHAAYQLDVALEMKSLPVIIEADGKIERYRILMRSPFTLRRLSDQKIIHQNRIQRMVSYSVSDADYATFTASKNAIREGIRELSEDYFLRIGALMNNLSTQEDSSHENQR